MKLSENLSLHLHRRLRERLPGRQVQRQFSHELSYGRHFGPTPSDARPAAVLVMLCRDGAEWRLPLTLRQQGLGIHSGQISLPGGGMDPWETAVDTALRECQEELGWAPQKQEVAGKLSPIFVYASNYRVVPVVAVVHQRPRWRLNPQEVAEVIEVPLAELCSDASQSSTRIARHAITMAAPCFRWKSYCIWGATAMILAELRAILCGNN